jgi:hypothetical protein
VKNFHHHTLQALKELLEATGVNTPQDIALRHIMRRVSETDSRTLAELYPDMVPGALLQADADRLAAAGSIYAQHWLGARTDAWAHA